MNTPTPEVEAVSGHAVGILNVPLLELARKLEQELDIWKANHDNQVELKRILMDRPDLGGRGTMLVALVAERDQLRNEIETLHIRHAAVMLHTQSVVEENTQLRKVCDWLADFVPTEKDLSGYNQLPHVKK